MASKMSFLDATVMRRSTITLKKESPIPDSRIVEIAKHSLLHGPSPFHVQSARCLVLLHEHHEKLWDMMYQHTQSTIPEAVFKQSFEPKLLSYKASYGTILFYDDPTAVDKMPPALQTVIKQFPEWADHSNGMAQYIAWTALCAEGFGANLQHYTQGTTEKIAKEWNLPAEWKLNAQLVFGVAGGPPRGGINKEFAPLEHRIKIYGENQQEETTQNGGI